MTSSGTYAFQPSGADAMTLAYARIGIHYRDMEPISADHPCVVYAAINIINGSMYVGATEKGLGARKRVHLYHAKAGKRDSKFYNAIRKHGAENFEFVTIRHCSDFFDALKHEEDAIAKLEPEYNLTKGGGGVKGYRFSSESKAKMSAAKKGKIGHPCPQWLKDKNAELRRSERRILSEGTKEKIRANAKKGREARRRRILSMSDGILYESVTAAARAYGLTTGQISYNCSGGVERKMRSGLNFKYADGDSL